MAQLIQGQHYVNFLRGTPQAYEKLATKDSDTLYFISEKDSTTGVLYMGDKLISASLQGTSLLDIPDISIEELNDNQLLAYDKDNNVWHNIDIADLISPIVKVMKGATDSQNGEAGLAPMPLKEDKEKFLKGDGTWSAFKLSSEEIDNIISQMGDTSLYWDNF